MWKLFHPQQKPKTPGRLECGGSSLLSAVVIRGKKPKLGPNAPLRVCGGGFCHFDRSSVPPERARVVSLHQPLSEKSSVLVTETEWPLTFDLSASVCSFKPKNRTVVLYQPQFLQ